MHASRSSFLGAVICLAAVPDNTKDEREHEDVKSTNMPQRLSVAHLWTDHSLHKVYNLEGKVVLISSLR